MDLQELLSAQGSSYHAIVYNPEFQYPNLKMDGTEEERLEIFDLKLNLESWIVSLRNIDDWRFPNKFQAINATNFRIKYWIEKANGRELTDEYKIGAVTNNLELNSEPFRIGPPDERTLKHVIEMIEQLTTIWSAVTMKYVEAVVKTSESMEERIMRCNGIVDFN